MKLKFRFNRYYINRTFRSGHPVLYKMYVYRNRENPYIRQELYYCTELPSALINIFVPYELKKL